MVADFDDERTPLPPATPFRGDDGLVTGAIPALIVPGANHPYAAAQRTSRLWALGDQRPPAPAAGDDGATTRMTRDEICAAIPGMAFGDPGTPAAMPARAEPLVTPDVAPPAPAAALPAPAVTAPATSRVRALSMPRVPAHWRRPLTFAAAGTGLFLAGLLTGLCF